MDFEKEVHQLKRIMSFKEFCSCIEISNSANEILEAVIPPTKNISSMKKVHEYSGIEEFKNDLKKLVPNLEIVYSNDNEDSASCNILNSNKIVIVLELVKKQMTQDRLIDIIKIINHEIIHSIQELKRNFKESKEYVKLKNDLKNASDEEKEKLYQKYFETNKDELMAWAFNIVSDSIKLGISSNDMFLIFNKQKNYKGIVPKNSDIYYTLEYLFYVYSTTQRKRFLKYMVEYFDFYKSNKT